MDVFNFWNHRRERRSEALGRWRGGIGVSERTFALTRRVGGSGMVVRPWAIAFRLRNTPRKRPRVPLGSAADAPNVPAAACERTIGKPAAPSGDVMGCNGIERRRGTGWRGRDAFGSQTSRPAFQTRATDPVTNPKKSFSPDPSCPANLSICFPNSFSRAFSIHGACAKKFPEKDVNRDAPRPVLHQYFEMHRAAPQSR